MHTETTSRLKVAAPKAPASPKKPGNLLLSLRNRHYLLLDVIFLALIPTLALLIRIGWPWDPGYTRPLILYTAGALLAKLPILFGFRLYSSYWRYASMDEMISILYGSAAAFVAATTVFIGVQFSGIDMAEQMPRSLPVLDGLLTLTFVAGTRFSTRMAEYHRSRMSKGSGARRVLVVGAGDAGDMIVREMKTSAHINLDPVGFLDDDLHKRSTLIHGVRVLGPIAELPIHVRETRAQEVIIAMPTAPGKTIRQVVQLCEQVGIPSRLLPGIYELLNGRASISRVRNVEIGDLLRREPVEVDCEQVRQMIAGKRVLVTGAGGSIGSELCSQILTFEPAELIAVGHGEHSLFTLFNRLAKVRASLNGHGRAEIKTVLADVRDRARLQTVFAAHRPQVVFHAAAHKHVPLTEANVDDAITTNVLGTRNLVDLSVEHGVERFVMISTDKAVNPVNVLGMTKRLAEMIVREAHHNTGRPFVAVRFGNVLGSRGSVVPFFQEQIAAGGPVTVTHPEIIRYFMTIPEAVALVLQAATLGARKEVFVLDMGDPVKIVDLARDMIELSGYQVGRDIDITFTGLRPGEKLYEELFTEDERPVPTAHPKILMARSENTYPRGWLPAQVDELIALAQEGRVTEAREKLGRLTCPAGVRV